MFVFVINKHGEALMPCHPRKARLLLKQQKAKIIQRQPLTIQLMYGSSGYTQPVNIGVDLGAKHVGIAMTSEEIVLVQGEIELRQDIKSLLETRKTYRRSRRNRKTRYRKARFLNRKKPTGWLPPSIQSRIDNTFHWIARFCSLVPNPKLSIEVGKFDVAKMINPTIQGVDYQQGQTYGYHDVRYFVLARDNYTCQVCKKSKDKIFNTHHIVYRGKGGSDRADNLITVCTDCHTYENHQKGQIFYTWMVEGKKLPRFKEGPFMNSLRKRVFTKFPAATITYGSVTTPNRKALGLEKSHANDAIAICGLTNIQEKADSSFQLKQFRKKKRSLHEATARKWRKQKNVDSKRNDKNCKTLKGFNLNDQVFLYERVGYITGFTGTGMAYVKDIQGQYITKAGKSYKQVSLSDCEQVRHNNNWQFIPHLTSLEA